MDLLDRLIISYIGLLDLSTYDIDMASPPRQLVSIFNFSFLKQTKPNGGFFLLSVERRQAFAVQS